MFGVKRAHAVSYEFPYIVINPKETKTNHLYLFTKWLFIAVTHGFSVPQKIAMQGQFLDGSLQKHDEFSEMTCAGMWLMKNKRGQEERECAVCTPNDYF